MFVEFLQVFLPIIINILLVALLVVAIIIGFKTIDMMDKMNHVVDSVSNKVDSLNGVFRAIDFATDKFNELTNKMVEGIVSGVGHIFKRKNKKSKLEEEE